MKKLSVPLNASDSAVQEWLRKKKVQASPAPASVLVEDPISHSPQELEELWAEGAYLSWLGGPALDTGAWPQRKDGQPLVHVASISLETLVGSQAFEISDTPVRVPPEHTLPSHGVLEVFHDLSTYGYSREDQEEGAWLVRIVTAESRLPLAHNAEALEIAPEPFTRHVLPYDSFTLPAAADLPLDDAEFERYQEALLDYNLSWQIQRGIEKTHYEVPTSHVYGHSSRGLAPVAELLSSALECTASELVLIAEFESWVCFPGWFADAGSLEVWTTQETLASGSLTKVWCLIRTD